MITLFIWSSKDKVYILGIMYQCDSNIGIYIGVPQVHTLKFAFENIVLGNLFLELQQVTCVIIIIQFK